MFGVTAEEEEGEGGGGREEERKRESLLCLSLSKVTRSVDHEATATKLT